MSSHILSESTFNSHCLKSHSVFGPWQCGFHHHRSTEIALPNNLVIKKSNAPSQFSFYWKILVAFGTVGQSRILRTPPSLEASGSLVYLLASTVPLALFLNNVLLGFFVKGPRKNWGTQYHTSDLRAYKALIRGPYFYRFISCPSPSNLTSLWQYTSHSTIFLHPCIASPNDRSPVEAFLISSGHHNSFFWISTKVWSHLS